MERREVFKWHYQIWIVDPDKNRIMVYSFEFEDNSEEYTFADSVKAGIFQELYVDFSMI